jgi:hypothetical protein
MCPESVVSLHPGLTATLKQFFLMLGSTALLLVLVLPRPATSSTAEVTFGVAVTLSPLEAIATAPSTVPVGVVFGVEAVIRNHGDTRTSKATASIHLPKHVEIVGPKIERNLGSIPADKYATVKWRVRALNEGYYAILVFASGTYGEDAVTGQDVVLVAAEAP